MNAVLGLTSREEADDESAETIDGASPGEASAAATEIETTEATA